MHPLFEHLQEATILKRFLDEFEKNPVRTILAVILVLGLVGGTVNATINVVNTSVEIPTEVSPPPEDLSKLPVSKPVFKEDGILEKLPEPILAEQAMQDRFNEIDQADLMVQERLENDELSDSLYDLISASGLVKF